MLKVLFNASQKLSTPTNSSRAVQKTTCLQYEKKYFSFTWTINSSENVHIHPYCGTTATLNIVVTRQLRLVWRRVECDFFLSSIRALWCVNISTRTSTHVSNILKVFWSLRLASTDSSSRSRRSWTDNQNTASRSYRELLPASFPWNTCELSVSRRALSCICWIVSETYIQSNDIILVTLPDDEISELHSM